MALAQKKWSGRDRIDSQKVYLPIILSFAGKWGGHFHPSPPRGAAFELAPGLAAELVFLIGIRTSKKTVFQDEGSFPKGLLSNFRLF